MTNNIVPTLEREEIPSEVIEELESVFDTVDWKYYNVDREELDDDDFMQMVSRKATYTKELDDFGPQRCLDPDTLEPTTIMANTMVGYIVRAKWDEKNSTVYPWAVKATGGIGSQREETTE